MVVALVFADAVDDLLHNGVGIVKSELVDGSAVGFFDVLECCAEMIFEVDPSLVGGGFRIPFANVAVEEICFTKDLEGYVDELFWCFRGCWHND